MATPISGPDTHGPGVRVPPPVMLAGICALAWALDRVVPVGLTPPAPWLGWAVIAAGGALAVWTAAVMIAAKTDPRPDKPDQALVERGPFGFSRNPIYLGFIAAVAGLALRWGTLWGWAAVVASFLLLDRYVVAREEAYLRGRFGAAYEAYAGRVRRWV